MRSTANPIVFTKLELTLQRLMDAVQDGYTHVTNGQVTPCKASKLANKFDVQYQVFADRNERARRKRANLGNAKWLCYAKDDVIYWWLLVTHPEHGDHFAHANEKLVNVTKDGNYLQFEQFELLKLPYTKPTKPKPSNYKERNKPTRLTWRINADVYQSIRERIIEEVRSGDINKLFAIVRYLYSMPGFGGIRSQVGKLVALYNAEVKRAGLHNAPKPLDKLRYIRRQANDGTRLGVLLKAFLNGFDAVKYDV